MPIRPLTRAFAAVALAVTMIGSNTVFAAHQPWASCLPTAWPADGALLVDDDQVLSVDGMPMAISPDGKWLAGPGSGIDREFCLWDVETLTPQCADAGSSLPVTLETVTWAPDSSAVAFSLDATVRFVDSDIFVMDIDGTLHNITDDGFDGRLSLSGDGPEVPVDIYPAWSRDSRELVFARTVWGLEAPGTALYAIGRDGGAPTLRFAVSPEEPFLVFSPMHWLDDGSILFSVIHTDQENSQNGVWKLGASGSVTKVVAGAMANDVPMPFVSDVSPDGTQATIFSLALAGQRRYEGGTDGKPIYFVADLATGALSPIQEDDPQPGTGIGSVGSFLPDGATIVSVQWYGGRSMLVFSRLDGTVMGTADLPEAALMPVANCGVSVADDGTIFIPVRWRDDADPHNGLILAPGDS
ncbi:MAG: hypothetical protein QM589_04445 [Thermomicrobiales bacterium]